MSTTELEPIDDRTQEHFIVDCDFHIELPGEQLIDYVDDEMLREKLAEFGCPPGVGMGWNGAYSSEVAVNSQTQGLAVSADEVGEVMEEFGTDVTIATPGTRTVDFSGARYPPLKNALARAYNDWILEHVVDPDQGIYGTVIVPDWDPEFGVEELERVGRNEGFVGAQNWFSQKTPWGTQAHDPIFEKLVELDLPLLLHPLGVGERFDQIGDAQRTYTEVLTVSLGRNLAANVMSLIMTGVFDRYPDLDVVFQEGGTNWIPYLANRADEFYQEHPEDVRLTERKFEAGERYLDRMPSEYIYDNIYVTTQPIALPERSDHREAMLTVSHADDMFMFSTDWPHVSTDTPNWVFDLDSDLQETIFTGNAEDVLRFPRPLDS